MPSPSESVQEDDDEGGGGEGGADEGESKTTEEGRKWIYAEYHSVSPDHEISKQKLVTTTRNKPRTLTWQYSVTFHTYTRFEKYMALKHEHTHNIHLSSMNLPENRSGMHSPSQQKLHPSRDPVQSTSSVYIGVRRRLSVHILCVFVACCVFASLHVSLIPF